MKFTIVKYPSKYSEDGFNHLLVRVIDGAIVGMVDPCAVDDLRKALGLIAPLQPEEDDFQLRLPFDEE